MSIKSGRVIKAGNIINCNKKLLGVGTQYIAIKDIDIVRNSQHPNDNCYFIVIDKDNTIGRHPTIGVSWRVYTDEIEISMNIKSSRVIKSGSLIIVNAKIIGLDIDCGEPYILTKDIDIMQNSKHPSQNYISIEKHNTIGKHPDLGNSWLLYMNEIKVIGETI